MKRNARIDQIIAEIAVRQYGLVSRVQLIGAGLPSHAIQSRVLARRLEPVRRGVYRMGPLSPPRSSEMSAVLACGANSVISHRSAGALWEICERVDAIVDVTLPATERGQRPGIRAHRTATLLPDEVTAVDGIPVTTPARTILDIAGQMSHRDLEQAMARAERSELADSAALREMITRHPRRPGVPQLRTLLDMREGPAFTRSAAEDLFLALVRRARLPAPRVNAKVGGLEVDFLWRAQGIVVEIDGFAFHSSKAKFENDHHRDSTLVALGLSVMRFTWQQLTNEPEVVLARVAQGLVAGRTRPA